MTTPAASPLPPAPAIQPPDPSTRTDGNVFFLFEETIKIYPAAAQTIAVERKTGTPANWMLTDRPQTANELYAAIKRLHGRREETAYEITFRDSAGHGSGGLVSMPSTMDEPPAALPAAAAGPYSHPQYPMQPPPYALPTAAPPVMPSPQPGAPFDANVLLTMQKQLFEMMQSMQSPRSAAPPPAPAPAAPLTAPPAAPDVNSLLAMQKQMFDMMQAMQAAAAGHAAPPLPQAPLSPPAAPSPVQPDQATTLLTMQKQMFEMMQAMQATAAGRAPPPPTPTPVMVAPAAQATDPTAAILAMQKQMVEMMLTMMQTIQRGTAPSAAGPFLRPRYGDPPGTDPRDARVPYQPPARPQTPSQQLREAASVFRDTIEVAREFGFGGQAAESPPEPEDDDSPVRVIDMGPAKGVINRGDGSLRGVETFMANLPDILKWVGEQRSEIVKARRENQQQQQQRLPPGFVVAGPDYQPPEGYVAVPVDQIPPQAQTTLPEPPTEMPPPIAQQSPAAAPPRRAWGMPEVPR